MILFYCYGILTIATWQVKKKEERRKKKEERRKKKEERRKV
jgi:hypothetical protein